MNEPSIPQSKLSNFYGRKVEIDKILIIATTPTDKQRSQVLLIEGPGGIGKSLLIQRTARELSDKHPDICYVGPLDMDDTDYRVVANTGWKIAHTLGEDRFATYISTSRNYQRKELEKVDRQTVLMQMNASTEYFIEDYKHFAKEHRVVIFIDTTEAVRGTYVWTYFTRVMAALPNTLFVLAGRPDLSLQQEGEDASSMDSSLELFRRMPLIGENGVERIKLVGWSKKEARDYIKRTELGKSLPEPYVENLLYLSRCQPLHIDLAIERLQIGKIPLLEQDVKKVVALTPLYQAELSGRLQEQSEEQSSDVPFEQLNEEGQELCKDFERYLLLHYAAPDILAEVIRRMAHMRRRLNHEMYEQIMAFEPAIQGFPAWDELLQRPWIRHRAGKYVTLHDIVSELVRRHIWPIRDPSGIHRRRLSEQAVRIYDRQIETYQADLDGLNKKFEATIIDQTNRQDNVLPELTDTLIKILEVDRRIWVLEAERLYYQLDADLTKGYESFRDKFNHADKESHMAVQEMLLNEIQGFLKQFPVGSAEYYNIKRCEAQIAIDDGDPEKAEQILQELLDHYQTPEEQYELLKLKGNANMRTTNRIGEALDIFEKVLRLTSEHNELKDQQGEALMEVGWARRQLGQLKEADSYYTRARAQIPLHNLNLIAQTENGLAYIKALVGKYAAAETFIQSALAFRRRQGKRESIGISLSVQGEVYRYQGKFSKAYEAYQEALTIFTETQNSAWLGQVQQQMAIALLQEDPKKNLKEARRYIESALYLCREYNARAYPAALNRAGRIYWVSNELEQALQAFDDGIQVAKAIRDNWFLAATCIERAELVYQLWKDTNKREYQASIFRDRDTIEKMEQSGEYHFYELFGRWHLIQGHVAWREGILSRQTECWQRALAEYKKGFPLIAEGFLGSHGIRALPQEGEKLKSNMLEMPRSIALSWCEEFNQAWGLLGGQADILMGIVSDIYSELTATNETSN
jgi:tetratricopeptide (TPR) repeat protein